jgi:cytochrome c oxidase subunit 2
VNISSQITILLAGIALTLVSFWYGQNHDLLPVSASVESIRVDSLFNLMMTIGTGIFLLVMGILVYSAFKFRREPGDESDGPPVHGNIPLEILWTAIPAIMVLGISILSFDIYNENGGADPMDHSMAHGKAHQQMASMPGSAMAGTLMAQADSNQQKVEAVNSDPTTAAIREDLPQKKDAPTLGVVSPKIGGAERGAPEFVVNVAGMQYAWLFTYPGTEVVTGELHVPINQKVLVNITANDVIHAFWVPQFRLKQDAIPGRQTEVRFTPNRLGEYPLVCAELCGAYHGAMNTKVVVESAEDVQKWLQSQQVASAEGLSKAVATTPAMMTETEYLAPYAQEVGISADTLKQLHSEHHSMS